VSEPRRMISRIYGYSIREAVPAGTPARSWP